MEHVSKSEAGESKWKICAVGIRERVAIVGRGILLLFQSGCNIVPSHIRERITTVDRGILLDNIRPFFFF